MVIDKIFLIIAVVLVLISLFKNLKILLLVSTLLLIICILWISRNTVSYYLRFKDKKLDTLTRRIAEHIPEINYVNVHGSDESFSLNKKDIHICLKDENGKYYPDNMLIYVILHELAHALCDEIDHTPKYEKIFNDLLERAENAGIYDSSIPPIVGYCGYS